MVSERPWVLAKALLQAVEDGFAQRNVELPARRFVSNGLVALDDELLAVSVLGLYGIPNEGPMSAEAVRPINCLSWRGGQFEIALLRCAPGGAQDAVGYMPPTPIQLEASARDVLRDASLITQSVLDAYQSDAFGMGANLALERWTSLGPDGSLVGGRLLLRIGLV